MKKKAHWIRIVRVWFWHWTRDVAWLKSNHPEVWQEVMQQK